MDRYKQNIERFQQHLEVQTQSLKTQLEATLSHRQEVNAHSALLKSTFEIPKSNKNLVFRYSNGLNVNQEEYHFLTFWVEYRGEQTEEILRTSFTLSDYCGLHNIYKPAAKTESGEERVQKELAFILAVIHRHGLLELIADESWTNVPLNFNDYK